MAFALHSSGAMLRCFSLLAVLAAPLVGLAQTASLTLTPPGPFGRADCGAVAGSADDVQISSIDWQVAPPSGSLPGTDWTYKVKALPSGVNCTTDGDDTNMINQSTLHWSTGSKGSYPGGSTDGALFLSKIISKSKSVCTGTSDLIITVCVQLLSGSTINTSISSTVTIQLAPPAAPTGVVVAPGMEALNVSWSEGSGGSVASAKYRVEVSPLLATCATPLAPTVACLDLPNARTYTTPTATTSYRFGGLVNGTDYGVRVYGISAGGNDSLPSAPPVHGQPVPVNDFWQQYQAQGGLETGGCGGGPAGLVSLLTLAGLALGLRRRP